MSFHDRPMSPATPESARELVRAILMSYFPMFIATLSLVTSIYNGYLNALFVDLIQRNVTRMDYMRTCKEVIDAYFQVKLRATVISRNRGNASAGDAMTAEQIEAANAVAKMGALGTYLANLRDETIRRRYTDMNMALAKAVNDAGKHTARRARQAVRAGRRHLRRPERRLREIGARPADVSGEARTHGCHSMPESRRGSSRLRGRAGPRGDSAGIRSVDGVRPDRGADRDPQDARRRRPDRARRTGPIYRACRIVLCRGIDHLGVRRRARKTSRSRGRRR